MYAEHLFLASQHVPRLNEELECTLFLGLCRLFTREKVLSLYEKNLTNEALHQGLLDVLSKEEGGDDCYPTVFLNVTNNDIRGAHQILSLLRNLLKLFHVDDLRNSDVMYERGEEPEHMLFLYLIQLIVIFVGLHILEKDLATIMSVAWATFLEGNFGNPLCAATLLKPMFIPYYDQHMGKKPRKGETGISEQEDPEARLKYYRLFTGYELDTTGSDVSTGMDGNLSWIDHSLLQHMQGCKLVERKSKKLWFVAPQMGDRMAMLKDFGAEMMGRPSDEKALKICLYLLVHLRSVDEMLKRGVSCVLPRIDVGRIKMMSPELNEHEFGLLVSAVKNNNIKVIGEEDPSYASSALSCSTSSKGDGHVSRDRWVDTKQEIEEPDGSPERKGPRLMVN